MLDESNARSLAHRKRRAEKRLLAGHVAIGSSLICRKCGAEFSKRHKREFYCATCKRVRANSGRRVGAPWSCAHCAGEIIVTHARMVYCDTCRDLQERNLLPAIRLAANERNKTRRKGDPKFAISRNMGAAIWKSVADRKEGRSWELLVDYTVTDLMRHLERQFLKGMSWERRADWHIDHITPLASFMFETPDDPGFKAAWSLTNLRPLWSLDNVKKGAKRTHLL